MSKKNISRYFLIDYENVNREGLEGLELLTKNDCVRIYYSSHVENLTITLHLKIIESEANFQYIKVDIPIKNAVDCRILFDIEELAEKKKELYIVSKDSDFDKPILELKEKGYKIRKVLNIKCGETTDVKNPTATAPTPAPAPDSAPSPAPKKKKQPVSDSVENRENEITAFVNSNFKNNTKKHIAEALISSTNKNQLNHTLQKHYQGEQLKKIFKTLKPFIKDWPAS